MTKYVIDNYIQPARVCGDCVVGVRAGDFHRGTKGLRNKGTEVLDVCSKLGSNVFQRDARVKRIALEGPTNGANALFVYRLK